MYIYKEQKEDLDFIMWMVDVERFLYERSAIKKKDLEYYKPNMDENNEQ